ncbi:hypothetical protein DBIPINDM_003536 [Mesorhizobium sp. AR02]|uniref:transcriptional regulator domain-containing protein n=1 Tax=Mesorhizobium sp. AR02 TaxID=2865837 RepID=UPI00216036A9|nr:DUF6499 domain-containing protein [Mesorhizobium sp. AR02]UVK50398.1 hypothetical protein DBIPINDM_003536 [Mesorhizobium sp. AR02]
MPISDWQSLDTIEQLKRLDRPGFAAELLRRNAAYRRDYAHTLRKIAQGGIDPDEARSNLAHRWGLRFFLRS